MCPAFAFSETSRFPAHFTPAELRQDLRDAFYQALASNQALNIQRGTGDPAGADPMLKDVWLGNEPELFGSLDKLEILLESTPETPEAVKDYFTLEVTFRTEDFQKVVVVRTSRPAVEGTEGGLMMFLTGKRARRTLVRGQNKASAVVALPETDGDAVKGVLICPLDLVQRSKQEIMGGAQPVLGPTGYRPVSVRIGVQASVKGVLLSGIRPGLARANVATSPDIPNERLHFDETFSKDPLIEVAYQGAAMTEPIAIPADGKMLQGLSLALELQNSAGYTRNTSLLETLEIAPVDRDFEFPLTAFKRQFKINSRTCFSILRTSVLKQEYSKENVKAP